MILTSSPITQDDSASSLLGTKTYRIRNIDVPVWEHGRSSVGTLMFQHGNIDVPVWEHCSLPKGEKQQVAYYKIEDATLK